MSLMPFGPYLNLVQAKGFGALSHTAKPCKAAGHVLRYTQGGGCIECARATALAATMLRPKRPRVPLSPDEREARAKAAKHRSDRSAKGKARNARRNRKRAAYRAAWNAANRDRINAARRAKHAANPTLAMGRKRRRRARRAGAEGTHTVHDAAFILALQHGRCAYCGDAGPLHLDHKRALARGGTNWPHNLQWLCGWHNCSKGTTHDAAYRDRHGIARLTPWDAAFGLLLLA